MSKKNQNIIGFDRPIEIMALGYEIVLNRNVPIKTSCKFTCGEDLAPDGFVGISFLTKDEVLVCTLLTNEQVLEIATVLVNAEKRGETEQ